MTGAFVNRIIPFSSVDGPGNRTAVFLQGCNIDCKYCHNPETRALCISCGECIKSCPAGALSLDEKGRVIFDEEKCIACDTCIHVCQNDSTPKAREMTPEEVYQRVKSQIPFIRGITLSGGECMLWPEFLCELFALAKKDGLTTLIDSNGTIPFMGHTELLDLTDGVMLDIKAFDSDAHRRITGAGNDTVLENALFLAKNKKLCEVRAVVVRELYDAIDSVNKIGKLLAPYNKIHSIKIKIIRFRPIGVRKKYAHYKTPDIGYLNEIAGTISQYGFDDVVIL